MGRHFVSDNIEIICGDIFNMDADALANLGVETVRA